MKITNFGNYGSLYLADCITNLQTFEANKIDGFVFDPPYKYLNNQVLETDYNECLLVREIYRTSKKDASVTIFGRGTSFDRLRLKIATYLGTLQTPEGVWYSNIYETDNEIEKVGLEYLISKGYKATYIGKKERSVFKEEMVWDKSYCSSPVLPISRVHENFAIFMRGVKKVKKVKIPYLEMKHLDFESIVQDVKRIKSALGNPKSLKALQDYLENNSLVFDTEYTNKYETGRGTKLKDADVSVATLQIMQNGMTEKSIIRTDRVYKDTMSTHDATLDKGKVLAGAQEVNCLNSLEVGMNEKSIIRTENERTYFNDHTHRNDLPEVSSREQRVLSMIENGASEKTIIRQELQSESLVKTSYDNGKSEHKYQTTVLDNCLNGGDAAVISINKMYGMLEKSIIEVLKYESVENELLQPLASHLTELFCAYLENATHENIEKSIIEVIREHYDTLHPTQKPVRLMERIIQLVSDENDVICDPFMGSCSTGVAAVNLQRCFIGIEILDQPTTLKVKGVEQTIDGFYTSSCKRFGGAIKDFETNERNERLAKAQQTMF